MSYEKQRFENTLQEYKNVETTIKHLQLQVDNCEDLSEMKQYQSELEVLLKKLRFMDKTTSQLDFLNKKLRKKCCSLLQEVNDIIDLNED